MTAAERVLWQRVQRRAAMLTPELAAALFLAFAALRDQMDEDELTKMVAIGVADRVFDRILSQAVLTAAFQPLREKLRYGIIGNIRYFARDVPIPPDTPPTLRIGFDILNPRVIDAIRELETRVIDALQEQLKETVRQAIEAGLTAGAGPRDTARGLRQVIGLGPSQEQQIRNFREALRGENGRSAFSYTLRDRRFDPTVRKGNLTEAQVDRMVDAYRRRRIAQNAETNARTASLDAMKLGQRLSWEDAIAKGIVDRARLRKTWIGTMDARERPEHVAMEHQTVGFDDAFTNGEMIPGDADYNCRCIARYWLAPAA